MNIKCLLTTVVVAIFSVTLFTGISYASASSSAFRIPRYHGNVIKNGYNVNDFKQTIDAVWNHMNYNQHHLLKQLVLETSVVETRLGMTSLRIAARQFCNFGLFQFRIDSAKDTMNYVKRKDPASYSKLMSLYDRKLNIRDNLMYNVPFGIALCKEYYEYRRATKFIKTLSERAKVWKKYYNTIYGSGTVGIYIKRVREHNKICALL